jgi:hypothetical protein
MCEFHLITTEGKQKLDIKRCKCPNAGIKYRYSTAAISTSTAPSSNVSINCALCPKGQRAIWRYNYLYHLRADHPFAPEEKYDSLWRLHPDEIKRVKKIWETVTRGVPIPKRREPKTKPLAISDAHSSRLSMQ